MVVYLSTCQEGPCYLTGHHCTSSNSTVLAPADPPVFYHLAQHRSLIDDMVQLVRVIESFWKFGNSIIQSTNGPGTQCAQKQVQIYSI